MYLLVPTSIGSVGVLLLLCPGIGEGIGASSDGSTSICWEPTTCYNMKLGNTLWSEACLLDHFEDEAQEDAAQRADERRLPQAPQSWPELIAHGITRHVFNLLQVSFSPEAWCLVICK